ncbi:hypothetical protein Avbf_17236 [Armadillidium vulgare]|nr:hypothetical protein Avbf_17236 [Armadillidium vulgare]
MPFGKVYNLVDRIRKDCKFPRFYSLELASLPIYQEHQAGAFACPITVINKPHLEDYLKRGAEETVNTRSKFLIPQKGDIRKSRDLSSSQACVYSKSELWGEESNPPPSSRSSGVCSWSPPYPTIRDSWCGGRFIVSYPPHSPHLKGILGKS